MKKIILSYKYESILLLIAISWSLFFSFVLQLKSEYTLQGDEGSYFNAAKKLYFDFTLDEGRPFVISAINGFPLLFGLSEKLLFNWIFIVNTISWFLTSILIYKITTDLSSKRKGFLLSVLFLFCIGNLAITFKFLSESIFILLLTFSFFLIHKFTKTRQHKYLTLTIALLILTTLVKPMAIGLVFIVVLAHIRILKKIIFTKFSFFIIISSAFVFFQMNTMKNKYGNYTISYIDSYTYYNYLGNRAYCLENNLEFHDAKGERFNHFITLSNFEQKKLANEDFKRQIVNNTSDFIKAYCVNFYINSTKGTAVVHGCENKNKSSYFYFFQYSFKAISKIQNILFSLLSVIVSIYFIITLKKKNVFSTILAFSSLYIIMISAISCNQGDRFHIVVYPLLLLQLTAIGCLKKINTLFKV